MFKKLQAQLALIEAKTAKLKEGSDSTPQAAQGVVAQTRTDVASIPTNIPPGAPKHLATFQGIVEKDVENLGLENDFYIIAMVNELLKTSSQPNDKVVSGMGFDKENLRRLMQAIFSIAQEKVVPQKKIHTYLRQNKALIEVIYRDMLGLDESSTEDDIQSKIKAFSSQLDQLSELFEYDAAGTVMKALYECNETQDPKKKEAIVKAHGFASQTRFHEGDIQGILDAISQKVKEKELAAEAAQEAAKIGQLFDAMYQQNQANVLVYQTLYDAFTVNEDDYNNRFKDAYFEGMDRAALMQEIDSKMRPNFAAELMSAAKSGDPYKVAMFKKISLIFGIPVDDPKFPRLIIDISLKLAKSFPNTR